MATVASALQGKALDGSVDPLHDASNDKPLSSRPKSNGRLGNVDGLPPTDRTLTGKQEHCMIPLFPENLVRAVPLTLVCRPQARTDLPTGQLGNIRVILYHRSSEVRRPISVRSGRSSTRRLRTTYSSIHFYSSCP